MPACLVPTSLPICLQVARGDPGFDAEVDRVHAVVVQALQELYDRHREAYNPEWKNRPLVIE